MSGDRTTASGNNIDDVLEMFHVCLGSGITSLRTVVVALEGFMDGMREILLTLKVEGDSFKQDEKLDSVPAARNVFVVLVRLNLLSDNIAALSPDKGVERLDVLIEIGNPANVLIDHLLPNPLRGWSCVHGVVVRCDDGRRGKFLDSQANVAAILVCAPDIFPDFASGLDELIGLPRVRRIVYVPLQVWALSFELRRARCKSFSSSALSVLLRRAFLLQRGSRPTIRFLGFSRHGVFGIFI